MVTQFPLSFKRSPAIILIPIPLHLCARLIRTGYIESRALPDVYRAMDHNKILKVYFDWIKFKLYKTPGLYAGISITLNGTWSITVVQSSSASQ